MSPPAWRIASACSTVASTSWVRVAHMLCTATGWPSPMVTVPTLTARVGFLVALIDDHRTRRAGRGQERFLAAQRLEGLDAVAESGQATARLSTNAAATERLMTVQASGEMGAPSNRDQR